MTTTYATAQICNERGWLCRHYPVMKRNGDWVTVNLSSTDQVMPYTTKSYRITAEGALYVAPAEIAQNAPETSNTGSTVVDTQIAQKTELEAVAPEKQEVVMTVTKTDEWYLDMDEEIGDDDCEYEYYTGYISNATSDTDIEIDDEDQAELVCNLLNKGIEYREAVKVLTAEVERLRRDARVSETQLKDRAIIIASSLEKSKRITELEAENAALRQQLTEQRMDGDWLEATEETTAAPFGNLPEPSNVARVSEPAFKVGDRVKIVYSLVADGSYGRIMDIDINTNPNEVTKDYEVILDNGDVYWFYADNLELLTGYRAACGIFAWEPGDEPAEVSVRRIRDGLPPPQTESDDLTGFTFTTPQPSAPVRFFDDAALKAMEELK